MSHQHLAIFRNSALEVWQEDPPGHFEFHPADTPGAPCTNLGQSGSRAFLVPMTRAQFYVSH
jgi:hypothetical protein